MPTEIQTEFKPRTKTPKSNVTNKKSGLRSARPPLHPEKVDTRTERVPEGDRS